MVIQKGVRIISGTSDPLFADLIVFFFFGTLIGIFMIKVTFFTLYRHVIGKQR